jgi:rhomboid family GlyGly-CTERM serine protease
MSPRFLQWIPVFILILVMFTFQLIGPEVLRYETVQIHKLQWWRFLSGHFVHANWVHYGLNMTGLILCVALTETGWKLSQWLWRILLLALGISLSFWVLQPQIGWYVGFSGILFGLYVLCSISVWPQQKIMSSILLSVIALKLTLDLWSSVKITSDELIGIPVLVEAHLYGVVTALIIEMVQLSIKLLPFTKQTGNS